MTPRIEEGHQLARQTERDGTPSITLASVAVGMMRASLRSAELSGAQYPASVRSRPPIITSMFRSTNLLEDVATLGRMTGSIEHFLFPAWEEFPFPARGDKAAQSSQSDSPLSRESGVPGHNSARPSRTRQGRSEHCLSASTQSA